MLYTRPPPAQDSPRRAGLRIATLYAALGALWILFSDRFLAELVQDPGRWTQMQTYKGWIFIAITALLLGWLVTRLVRRLETKQAQVEHLNRTHRLLSGINGTIVRVRNRDELLDCACELAVRQGDFRLARIVLCPGPGGQAPQITQAVADGLPPYPDLPPLAYCPYTPNPSRPLLFDSPADTGLDREWQAQAQAAGIGALAALPIPHWSSDEPARGWLELGAALPSAFDADEMRLLEEIAADIGLGLETIDKSASIETLAHFDPLTGRPNETLLYDRLQQALTRTPYAGRVLGLLLAEVPELRRLTDLHGSRLGDRCRKALADYLVAMVRDGDTVARTGRYSYAILLTDMARTEDLVDLTERLLHGPEVRIDGETLPIRLALRGGAALFPADGRNAETLLRHAALALHNNTAAPGTCDFYSPNMNEMAQTRLQLTHGLQHAIEREELSLAYQLLVDASTKEPRGAEALLRWNSTRYGQVSPAQFIPIAEESKIIHALGDWVLEQACRQLLAWHAAGLESFYVSVNIAAPQLLGDDFAAHLQGVLGRMGALHLAPALAIEVTETAFMGDIGRAERTLHEIRRLGIRVYLDDFGTGFSSLSYLSRLPVDVLKIDRAFIHGLPADERAGSLVKAIIALAHSLGLKVIAEGVETREQADWLQARGCDLLQGFLYSRPAPAGEIGLEQVRNIGLAGGPGSGTMDRK
jgi:diguanylate cyclase (GGDEF)-like protein